MSKKAKDLIPKIIGSKTKEDAIGVLNETLKALHLSSDYTELVKLKDQIDEFQKQFKQIESNLKELAFPRDYEDLAEIREQLAFLYRDVSDNLSFEINSAKTLYAEDKRTLVKAQAIKQVKQLDKSLSDTGAHQIYGDTDIYQQYLNYYHMSYGLYKELHNLLESIKLLSDSVASQASHSLHVLKRDVK